MQLNTLAITLKGKELQWAVTINSVITYNIYVTATSVVLNWTTLTFYYVVVTWYISHPTDVKIWTNIRKYSELFIKH